MENLLRIIQQFGNLKEKPIFVKNLTGGDINRVYLILSGERFYVVKQNTVQRYPEMFEKEYRALKYLHENSPLCYPFPISFFSAGNQQYLLMEYLEKDGNSKAAQERFGQELAEQHKISHKCFGWDEDNYIGSLIQVNTPKSKWDEFYAVNRILIQGRECFDKGLLSKQDIRHLEKICLNLKNLIPEEDPTLLHGDLWSGNYFISNNGSPVVYDPAVYFGHREIDMAMTRLFGGFSDEFYTSYQSIFPLTEGWEKRTGLFQLYPVLVHLNLFGTSYLSSVRERIKRYI